ncbi:MAG: hypothetical protein F7B17_00055 [Desulfurococcales archaeon]|nr:hypothetical protein [Desulfurococcales archaeon]
MSTSTQARAQGFYAVSKCVLLGLRATYFKGPIAYILSRGRLLPLPSIACRPLEVVSWGELSLERLESLEGALRARIAGGLRGRWRR